MKGFLRSPFLFLRSLVGPAIALVASTALGNEFFAMDNGLRDVKSIAGKAALLEELGYDGVTWRPGGTAEALREMSARGLKMHALKIALPVSKNEGPPNFPLADLEAIEGTDAVLWVTLQSEGGDDDDAARALHQLNAVARPMGLRIALYPHLDTHVESLEDALRIVELVADDNVGVSLTLCHQLKLRGVEDLEPVLRRALPKLFLVQVSGADTGDTKTMGWDRLIQPLGQGSYDVEILVKILRQLDYRGPIGVIGFGLRQPAQQHLKQSIDYWRSLPASASGGVGGKVPSKDTALVFLIAGQSNAGGVAAFSPETNEKAGMAEKHPTIPGSTAREVGIPTTMDAYPRCFIWAAKGFEGLKPGRNLKTGYRDPMRHGIELPMAMLLRKRYPSAGIYFIKHGPGGHNLHTQWKAGVGPDYRAFMAQFTPAMTDLKKRYEEVRVIGLYWDQGESDREQALQYEDNLRALFAALRKDTGIPELQIYVREQGIFQHDKPDFQPIVEAQIKVCGEDPHAHLLELDLGSNEKNFKAWAWTDRNGHLSSKAYLELSRRICRLVH